MFLKYNLVHFLFSIWLDRQNTYFASYLHQFRALDTMCLVLKILIHYKATSLCSSLIAFCWTTCYQHIITVWCALGCTFGIQGAVHLKMRRVELNVGLSVIVHRVQNKAGSYLHWFPLVIFITENIVSYVLTFKRASDYDSDCLWN